MQRIDGRKHRCLKPQHLVTFLIVLTFECEWKFDLSNVTYLIHFLIYVDRANLARLLIANGANVNANDKFSQSPLHMAALEGKF